MARKARRIVQLSSGRALAYYVRVYIGTARIPDPRDDGRARKTGTRPLYRRARAPFFREGKMSVSKVEEEREYVWMFRVVD